MRNTKKAARGNNYSHGMCRTKFYFCWQHIKLRCDDPKQYAYRWYGEKGISYCDRWKEFLNFKKDMHESYLEHVETHGETDTTIERLDNGADYSKDNCTWVTKERQGKTHSRVKTVTYKGESKCMSDWARQFNMPQASFWRRLNKYKMTMEEIEELSYELKCK